MITKREIVVTTGSASKTYDGTPLWSDEVSADRLLRGHEIVPYNSTYITNVNESVAENRCTAVEIFSDGENVTNNYTVIEYRYGTLEILPCEVTVTTGSVTRLYDPQTPISSNMGSLDLPLRAYAQLSGNTVHRGKGIVPNHCDISQTKIISEETGEDITDNFIILGHIWGDLNAIDTEDGDTVYLKVAIYPKSKIYTGSQFNMSIVMT